ncbi:unnamed protein product [Discula destructiva]
MASSSVAPRLRSRASCLSTTTYHSFQKNESPEPDIRLDMTSTALDVLDTHGATVGRSRASWRDDGDDKRPTTFQMVRQDSGYESGPSTPRISSSNKRRSNSSRVCSSSSRLDRTQQRPSLRRSGASNPVSRVPGRSSLNINRPSFLTPQQQQNLARKNSYFQFPAPENLEQEDAHSARPSVDLAPVILKVNTANLNPESMQSPDPPSSYQRAWPNAPISPLVHNVTPTTHYWTSDQTRQLEYAAIDAASQGVRGWIMRNVVPDCLVPRNNRRAGFEDDGGSVRRYRIELEVECPEDSVPPSPVGEKLRGFRARAAKRSWWATLKGCNA